MPESSEVIYFIDPEDEEFAEIIKNARKKLEVQAVLAMPCTRTKSRNGVTCVQKSIRLRMGAKVHCASLMDTCHLKNAVLEKEH